MLSKGVHYHRLKHHFGWFPIFAWSTIKNKAQHSMLKTPAWFPTWYHNLLGMSTYIFTNANFKIPLKYNYIFSNLGLPFTDNIAKHFLILQVNSLQDSAFLIFSCANVILRFLLLTNLCNIVCLWSRPIAHRFEYFFNRIWVALACLCYSFSHDCMTYFSFVKNLEKYEWRSKDFGTYSDFSLFAKRDVITWQPPQPYNFVKVAVSILRFTQKWRNLFASCRRFIFSPVLLT